MTVRQAGRGKKLDDGTSAIEKRYYGRSRKRRVRPEAVPGGSVELDKTGEPPTSLQHALATTVKPHVQSPPAAAPADTVMTPPVLPCSPSELSSSSSSSSRPSATSRTTSRSFSRRPFSVSVSRQSGTTPPTASDRSAEDASESFPDRNRHRNSRRRRHRSQDHRQGHPTSNVSSTLDRSQRGHRRHHHEERYESREGRGRSHRRRRSRGTTRTEDGRIQRVGGAQQDSDWSDGSSFFSSSGSLSDWNSASTTASSSFRAPRTRGGHDSYDRQQRFSRRQSNSEERYGNGHSSGRSNRSRGGRTRSRRWHGRQGRRRCSGYQGRRTYVDKRTSRRGTRHRNSTSRRHRVNERGRHSSSQSSGRVTTRDDKHRRKNQRYRDQDQGRGRNGDSDHRNRRGRHRSSSSTIRRRLDKACRGDKDETKLSALTRKERNQRRDGTPSVNLRTGAGREGGRYTEKKGNSRVHREDLDPVSFEALVNLQRIVRGFLARKRVTGMQFARAFLRSACFGVMMDIIDAYIREDAAPSAIADVLAEGFKGAKSVVEQREEAVEIAQGVLEEMMRSLIRELVSRSLTDEADNHLDVVFVRNRRNPLLVTVDDLVAETLRVSMRKVVKEVVREVAEEFMSNRRVIAFVEDIVDDGVERMAGPVAEEVYYTAVAQAVFKDIEEEICSDEARSIVAECMAPFENHLVELQRNKDLAAIQAAALNTMVKRLQLQHAARTVGQRGKQVIMNDINGKTLNLLLAGRFLAILRAAETNRLQVSTSPLLFVLFRRMLVRSGRTVLLEELARELDRDESELHTLEVERNDEMERHRRKGRHHAEAG